jgi:carboxyl-terminal processing protease
MHLVVKNVGEGRSFDTQANLSNLSGDGILLKDGRFDLSNMAPGDVRRVAFSFDVRKELEDDEAVVMLSVGDRDLREFATEKVKMPIEPPATVEPATGVKKAIAAGARLLDRTKDAQPFGRLAAGTAVSVTGRVNGHDRVDLGGGRYAFVPASDLEPGGTATKGAVPFEDVYSHAPPELRVEATALATRADTITIKGRATANERLLDVFGFVGGRKVFYQSNKGAKDARASDIAVDVPLKPGVNVINVVARENPDSTTRRVVVVRRDGPDGAILKTAKDDDAAEWFDAGQPMDD